MNTQTIFLRIGKFTPSRKVLQTFEHEVLYNCLARHRQCDWGDVSPDEWRANNLALRTGDRVRSVFNVGAGPNLLIITSASRESTTAHLSSEQPGGETS